MTDYTPLKEAAEKAEEAIRLAEVGEYLYDAKAFVAGNGYDEPREFSIHWEWQQSKPNEYGQGVLLAEATAWHREMAESEIETNATRLRTLVEAIPLLLAERDALREALTALSKAGEGYRDTGWENYSDGYAAGRIDVANEALQALSPQTEEEKGQ